MPLAVPILRALYVFLNVFETYKTLKPPPPSARTGQPTVRAISVRKRAMKGCMTVWMVWTCFILYEKTFDGIVGLLVPFYQELKSLVILFFLLTRARGAEPVYLHILRPLIKPHTTTIDATLHFSHSFGDFLLLVSRIPLEYAFERYHGLKTSFRKRFSRQRQPPADLEPSHSTVTQKDNTTPTARAKPVISTQAKRVSQIPTGVPNGTANGTVRARRRPLETAHARSKSTSGPAPPKGSSSAVNPPPNHTKQQSQPEIWYPPPSVYRDEGKAPIVTTPALPTPPSEVAQLNGNATIVDPVDEWRKYEPFPSAYPPTPLTHTTTLPSERVASGSALGEIGEEVGVVDEWRKYEPFPAAYPPTPLPSTSRLPPLGRPLSAAAGGIAEGTNGGDHSNTREDSVDEDDVPEDEEDEMNGVHEGVLSEHDMEVDEEDDYDEEEEDEFNFTLQTPQPISRYQNFSAASSTDPNDDSTGLSTVDLGSPLRTRTNSEASTLAGSEASSVVGKKRTLAVSSGGESVENGVRRPVGGVRATAAPKFAIKPKTASTRTQIRPIRARRPPASVEPSSAGATTDDKESMEGSDASSMTSKKRRVGPGGTMRPPPGAVKPRPGIPSRSESDKTTSSEGAPRKPRVNTAAASSSRPVSVRKVTDPSTDSDRTLGRTSRSSTLVAQSDDGSSTIGRSRARVGNRA